MKSRIVIALAILISSMLQAQTNEYEQVGAAVKGYIENFFENKYDEMEIHLHDELSKRGVNQDGSLNKNLSKADLKEMLERNTKFPLEHQRNIITEIKIDKHVATAVLKTGYPKTRWTEYIHLAKLDGRWKIMDVFWSFDKMKIRKPNNE